MQEGFKLGQCLPASLGSCESSQPGHEQSRMKPERQSCLLAFRRHPNPSEAAIFLVWGKISLGSFLGSRDERPHGSSKVGVSYDVCLQEKSEVTNRVTTRRIFFILTMGLPSRERLV